MRIRNIKKKKIFIILSAIILILVSVYIYLVNLQPLLKIDRLSIFKSIYNGRVRIDNSYIYGKDDFHIKASGYYESGYLHYEEEIGLEYDNVVDDATIMFVSLYGFDKNTNQYDSYKQEYDSFKGSEEKYKINDLEINMKLLETDSKVYFEKGNGIYFIRFESLVNEDEALFKKNVRTLLGLLLNE